MTIIARPYQTATIDAGRRLISSGLRRIIFTIPCGGGKTAVAAIVAASAVAKGRKVLFIAHMRELIDQASKTFASNGVFHGVIMSGKPYTPWFPVQIASKGTLHSRAMRGSKIALPEADIVITDECHLSTSKTWEAILRAYPKAIVIGLTATPARKGGNSLGTFYQAIVQEVTAKQLLDDNFLVPCRVYAPDVPNLKGIHSRGGEFVEAELAKRFDNAKLVGNIVKHWEERAKGRLTVAFAIDRAHSRRITEQFQKAGYRWEHVDGQMATADRDRIHERLVNRELDGVSNCGIYTMGWDCPEVSCAILARPVKSFVLFKQMVGRPLRPAPWCGKSDAVILDHAGCCLRHGLPHREIVWSLDAEWNATKEAKKDEGKEPKVVVCPKCYTLFQGSNICPSCGYIVLSTKKKDVAHKQGTLVELVEDPTGAFDPSGPAEQTVLRRTWLRYVGISISNKLSIGVAASMFKTDTGIFPWEVKGLPCMPKDGEWQKLAVELFPNFGKKGQKK